MRGKMLGAAVVALLSAFAQQVAIRSSDRNHESGTGGGERSKDLRDGIPADLRNSVDSEIRERAFAAATDEAGRRFGVVFSPAAWTNRCGKGLIVADLDDTGYAFKYDQNGCVVQSGCDADFEEVVWRQKRRVELRDQFWRDKKIVDSALSNVVARTARMRTAYMGRTRGLLSARRLAGLLDEGARKPEKDDAAEQTKAAEQERARTVLAAARMRRAQRQLQEAVAEREEARWARAQLQEELPRRWEALKRKADETAPKGVAETDVSRWRAAFKKIVGFEMGQKIAQEMESGSRSMKLERPYRYFDTARLHYVDGCLYEANLEFESNGKYALSSLDAEAKAVSADLARRFGVELSEGRRGLLVRSRGLPVRMRKGNRNAGDFFASVNTNGWYLSVRTTTEDSGLIYVSLSDSTLREELKRNLDEKREAKKAVLPVFGSSE